MFNLSPSTRIFVHTKPIDMRKSFDGLFGLVRSQFQQDPFSGSLFLFEASAATSSRRCGGTLMDLPSLRKSLRSVPFVFLRYAL